MNISILKLLRDLQENLTSPGSKFSASTLRALASLFDTGVLAWEPAKRGRVVRLIVPVAINEFIISNFPSEGQSGLLADSNRARSILQSKDSKKGNTSQIPFAVMRGFGNCILHQGNGLLDAAALTRLYGVCALKVDRDSLWSFEGSVALVENLEVFWDIEKILDVDLAIYLSGRISNQIIEWLASNQMAKAKLIHVGDYDPVGLDEFLRVHSACGDRVKLFIPENIKYLFSTFGNPSLIREKPSNQKVLSKLRSTNNRDVLTVLPLIEEYGCVVEQEILLAYRNAD